MRRENSICLFFCKKRKRRKIQLLIFIYVVADLFFFVCEETLKNVPFSPLSSIFSSL
jgi:hypothetical protein